MDRWIDALLEALPPRKLGPRVIDDPFTRSRLLLVGIAGAHAGAHAGALVHQSTDQRVLSFDSYKILVTIGGLESEYLLCALVHQSSASHLL